MSRIPQHEQPFDALVRQGLALLEEHRRTLGMQPGRTNGREPLAGAGKSGLGDAVLDPGIRPLTPSSETLSGTLHCMPVRSRAPSD